MTNDEENITEAATVSTYEEAAEIFEGVIPNYTAPEGYELKEIAVDPYSMYATYASLEDEFEICTYAYDSGLVYYNLQEGELVPINGPVVELVFYDDEVGYANAYTPEGVISFYFSGIEQAAAEEILKGLK